MDESQIFLQSKRFWSMPVGYGISWLVTKFGLVAAGVITDADVTTVTTVITGVVVWLFGMAFGQRKITVVPKAGS